MFRSLFLTNAAPLFPRLVAGLGILVAVPSLHGIWHGIAPLLLTLSCIGVPLFLVLRQARSARRSAPWATIDAGAPPDISGDGEGAILHFSDEDPFAVEDVFRHVMVHGGPGSGKSSGGMAWVTRGALRAGFGALFTTYRRGDADRVAGYASESGREGDVVRVSSDGSHRLNLLDYLVHALLPGDFRAAVEILFDAQDAVEGKGGAAGRFSDVFWQRETTDAFVAAAALAGVASPLSMQTVLLVLEGAYEAARAGVAVGTSRTLAGRLIRLGRVAAPSVAHPVAFQGADEYFARRWTQMSEDQRRSVLALARAAVSDLVAPPFDRLFNTDSTFTPEQMHRGAILLLDLPVEVYGETGRKAQLLLKRVVQLSTESRDVTDSPRPCIIVVDEAPTFLLDYDARFMAVSRGVRTGMVLASQNIHGYRNALGPTAADEMLGLAFTHVFHQQAERETNRWAGELFGDELRLTPSLTDPHVRSGEPSPFRGLTPHRCPVVRAEEFRTLRTGGLQNNREVEGLVFQTGRVWAATGRPRLLTTFPQSIASPSPLRS